MPASDHKSVAFDHAKLSKNLSAVLHKNVDPKTLPFQWIDFAPDLKSITFQVDSAKFKYDLVSGQCKVTEVIRPEIRKRRLLGRSF